TAESKTTFEDIRADDRDSNALSFGIWADRSLEMGKGDRRTARRACVQAARRARPLRNSIDLSPRRLTFRCATSYKLMQRGRRRISILAVLPRKSGPDRASAM